MPLLISQGITAAVGTGVAGLPTSLTCWCSLSQDLPDGLREMVDFICILEGQMGFLVAVSLQNCRALGLTAKKGKLHIFLWKKYHLLPVMHAVRHRHKPDRKGFKIWCLFNLDWCLGLDLKLLPLTRPLVCITLPLILGPCFLRLLTSFTGLGPGYYKATQAGSNHSSK